MIKELEEAANNLYPELMSLGDNSVVPYDNNKEIRDSFIEGANWMEQRMFTTEDMFEFAGYMAGVKMVTPDKDPAEVFHFWVHKYKTDKIII